MKTVKIGSLALAACFTASVSAGTTFVAGDSNVESQICIAAASNDLQDYQYQVENFHVQTKFDSRLHRIFANNLTCNDKNVVAFARKYGAKETADYIAAYLVRKPSVSVRQDTVEVSSDKDEIVVVRSSFAK